MSYCVFGSYLMLRPFTQLQSRDVLLKDIIADSEDIPEEIGKITIKRINRPGIKVVIPIKKIRKILRNNGYDIKIIHPDNKMFIRAEIPVSQVDFDYLNEIVKDRIMNKINLKSDEKLEIEWKYFSLKFPKNFDVSIDKYSSKYRKVYVTISWQGTKLRRIRGKINIMRSYKVLTARYDLEKGHKVSTGDIIEEIHYSFRKLPEISEGELIGKVLISRHRSGEIIKKAYLKKEIIVKKGQKIRISKTSDSLNISLLGIALNSGGIGDSIKVKSLGTKSTYSCQIVNKNKIEFF